MNSFAKAVAKNSPAILTGMGIAGMIGAVVWAVKATPKAERLIRESAGEKEAALTRAEKVRAAWKCYIPAAAMVAVSAACVITAQRINTRRGAALALAYSVSETALREYGGKVLETVGEKKERAIRDAVDEDRMSQNPVDNNQIIFTGKGESLCCDALSGRYFRSDIDKINKAVNNLNKQLLDEGFVSLNDFYDELGLEQTDLGGYLGWNVDDELIEPRFSSHLTPDKEPCLYISYRTVPKYDFDRLL